MIFANTWTDNTCWDSLLAFWNHNLIPSIILSCVNCTHLRCSHFVLILSFLGNWWQWTRETVNIFWCCCSMLPFNVQCYFIFAYGIYCWPGWPAGSSCYADTCIYHHWFHSAVSLCHFNKWSNWRRRCLLYPSFTYAKDLLFSILLYAFIK